MEVTSRGAPPYREVFEGHFDYVWGVLRRLGVREEDVEDLAHEVFLHVHRKFADYEPDRPLRPWLFGFAFRVAAQHRRSAKRRPEQIGVDEPVEDPAPLADQQLSSHERHALLWQALDSLDLDQRALLVMHEWDDIPIPEIARALEIPVNTAYTRLRAARLELGTVVKRLSRHRRDAR